MAQRYTHALALERMSEGSCPECGRLAEDHSLETAFWIRFDSCSLLPKGVVERIVQYREDRDG